jgi:hypothetical protein
MINSNFFLILSQTHLRKVTRYVMTSSQKGKNWTLYQRPTTLVKMQFLLLSCRDVVSKTLVSKVNLVGMDLIFQGQIILFFGQVCDYVL